MRGSAKRAAAQSMAREFGSRGIHVAHIIIDDKIGADETAPMPDSASLALQGTV